jgi:hypothetical protein
MVLSYDKCRQDKLFLDMDYTLIRLDAFAVTSVVSRNVTNRPGSAFFNSWIELFQTLNQRRKCTTIYNSASQRCGMTRDRSQNK